MKSQKCLKWDRIPLALGPARNWVALGLALSCLSGCATTQTSRQEYVVFPPSYVQEIYGVEVLGEDGKPLDHPFHGGFNLPRPQLVDIDGDQDLDLFVQELTGHIKYFENTGSTTAPSFTWRK